MIIFIDTTKEESTIALCDDKNIIIDKTVWTSKADHTDKVLVALDQLFKKNKVEKSDLQKIIVDNSDGSYTALRVGVTIANFLGYSLDIPVEALNQKDQEKNFTQAVLPKYSMEPKITIKKQ